MRSPRPLPTRRAALGLLLAAAAPAGCGFTGYSIRAPYRADVETVYVPIFKATTFRRDVGQNLTKLVQQEIQNRTPFKVVGSPEGADTVLEGTITYVDKNPYLESPNNLPRQVSTTIMAQVRWYDARTNAEVKPRDVPPAIVIETTNFFPEIGETSMLGFQKDLEKLARDIVNMMEEPW